VAVQLYTPQLVQPYAPVKNSDVNANLLLIQQAFNAISQYDYAAGSYSFGNANRNVLMDLSSTSPGSWLTVTLPENPTIGDPAVKVTVATSGFSSTAQAQASVVVVTKDGTNIMGVPTTPSLNGLPFLTNAGDDLSFLFIGGSYGWIIAQSLVTSYVTPPGTLTMQSWDPNYLHCFHGLDTVVDTTNITNLQINLEGINRGGLSASFVIAPGLAPQNLVTSSGAQFFNGVAGAFLINATTSKNIRYRFTCLDVDNFSVST
jgi:hypothetical protein